MYLMDFDYRSYTVSTINALVDAFPESYELLDIDGGSSLALIRKNFCDDKVAICVLSGSLGGPATHFTLDEDLADVSVLGLPFASPNAYAIYEAGKKVGKKGVVFMYNNYMGDRINTAYAVEMLRKENFDAYEIGIKDDAVTADENNKNKRNGQLALIYAVKIAKAAAKKGYSAKEISRVLEKLNERCATLTFAIDDENNKVEYGTGISEEPPKYVEDYTCLKNIMEFVVEKLVDDVKPKKGEKAYALVNKLAKIHVNDSYVAHKYVLEELKNRCDVGRVQVGSFANLNMMDKPGFQVCLLMADEEIQELLKGTVKTPVFWI